jgi:hypothetical protein
MNQDHLSIQGIERLTAVYGDKLSFHDSEVIRLELRRGRTDLGEASMTVVFHLFAVEDMASDGCTFAFGRHNIVTLHFDGIQELELSDFNHQNVLMGLNIRTLAPPTNGARFKVSLPAAYGLDARFNCFEITLTDITPCLPSGSVYERSGR